MCSVISPGQLPSVEETDVCVVFLNREPRADPANLAHTIGLVAGNWGQPKTISQSKLNQIAHHHHVW